jgi:putative addiction module component (TIGR02574 family)
MTLDALLAEVRKLPREEQVDLLDELVCIVESDQDAVALTPAQAEDLDRRIKEFEAGKAKLIPGDEAIAHLRNRK